MSERTRSGAQQGRHQVASLGGTGFDAPPVASAERSPSDEPAREHAKHHAADRWHWRRRIRADPAKYRIYRFLVAVLGGLLILLGAATGWLPGPGGIPLVLGGLAVLASEFTWARRLLQWLRQKLHQGRLWMEQQPLWLSWAGGAVTVAGIVFGLWAGLAVFGYPQWTPHLVSAFLVHLPGVESSG